MLNTELRTASIKYRGREATVYLNRGNVRIDMQCSGNCLVSIHHEGKYLSSYEDAVYRNGFISDRMYGGDNCCYLNYDEIYDIRHACDELRRRNTYDPSLAPGPNFKGY